MTEKLTIHLVTYNGEKYISPLLTSLQKQTFQNFSLHILDNHSSDDTIKRLKQELAHTPFEYRLTEKNTNIGFAAGHNELYQNTDSEYFLLLNQDIYIDQSDMLEKLIHFLDHNSQAAAVSPRLMKWDFNTNHLTDTVDAIGLNIYRNRRFMEGYTQCEWAALRENFDSNILETFGVSGTLPVYRRSMIDTVAFNDNTFFDELHHSYKEDVDLAWRLQSAGFKSFVLLDAVAYHDRSSAGPKKSHDFAAAKNKKNQSRYVRYHGYKNHIYVLIKNLDGQNFLVDFPYILWYEVKKFGYYLLLEPRILTGLIEVIRNRKSLLAKRKQITSKRRMNPKTFRKYWQ